ncbi:MAG: hypothetical protein RLZZ429_1234 [Bacteroidota bacterium]|jgi:hypothetical protein
MVYERYDYEANRNRTRFSFISSSHYRNIHKLVLFRKIGNIQENYFSLEFGDWDPITNKLNVISISNNGDRDKVLNTVACTVLDFMHCYPNSIVFAKGSTLSRTRLYQIGINKNISVIQAYLNIYGFIDNQWEVFSSKRNYQAFYVLKRNGNFK